MPMPTAYTDTGNSTVHVPVGFSESGEGLFWNLPNAVDGFSEAIP